MTQGKWSKGDEDYFQEQINKSKPYSAAKTLHTRITEALKAKGSIDMPLETKKSAEAILQDLQKAMDAWGKTIKNNTVKQNKYQYFVGKETSRAIPLNITPSADAALLSACQTSLNTHTSHLIHAPDFWSQVYAAINEFTKSLGIGPIITNIEPSDLSKQDKDLEDSVESIRSPRM